MSSLPRPEPFFDRRLELDALARSYGRAKSGLAMVYGRRRVGKTYLLQRFLSEAEGASGKCYYLADQSTAEIQRLGFGQRLVEAFPTGLTASEISTSWNSLLRYFGNQASKAPKGKAVLVLDEFPYLVDQARSLPSVLQAWWDEEGAHSQVFVVLCGSQLSTMAALADGTAPLHGRFNAGRLKLEPMAYSDVGDFYRDAPGYGSREKLLMYGAFGGTPRYHGEANPSLAWDAQIVDLLLRPGAPFDDEARSLLTSEQIRDPAAYNAILAAVASGRTRYSQIQDACGLSSTALSHPIGVLQSLGWIEKERSFGETSDRRSIYRIADPFLHFWHRFGAPLASAFRFDDPSEVFKTRVEPYLNDYMGRYVFEDVCAQWLHRRAKAEFGLEVQDVKRYWSRDGRVEIDLVAELKTENLLFGECRWNAHSSLGIADYVALRAKVDGLPSDAWKRNARFILFSLGGFTDELRTLARSEGVLLVNGEQMF